jgi:tetratricopeptide (TPR) repeat protein
VVWVDAAGANASELLAPRVGAALAEAGFGAGSADAATLVRQLAGKEMLLVIDGLEDASQTAPLLSQLCGASSDLSILVTAWSAPRLRAEKAIFVDASQLVQAADEPQGSAAARLLAGAGHHQWTLSDKRIRAGVERIALACDGLPMLLEAASHMLQTMWPNELLARLDRDAATLVREAGDGGERLVRWLQAAPADARALLALIGRCRSWVTREDIVTLMHPQDEGAVAAAVDYCVRQHYLLRRVRQTHQGAWSEFRVPRFVQATLAACQQTLPMAEALAHVSRWLAAGPQPPDGDSVQAAAWFDDRIDDFDAVVHEWQTLARHEDVAALLLPHAAAWPQSAQGERVLGWLAGLGERLEPVGNAAAARLHLERARLRAQFGQLHGAFEDAGHALARLEQAPDASLRQEALKLMERYGSGEAAGRFPRALDERGIEAGESLLRVAQLSLRHGAMPKALQLAGEAAGVFNYFGLTRGLLKAHQLRAKIAFGMGDLVTAQQCVVHAERTARALGDGDEDAHAQIVRCHLLMAEMQMARAVELASAVMAKPDCAGKPRLLARGLLAMGWAQYAMGALPVAKAMCNELAAVTRESNSASLHLQTEVLATLIDARQGRPEAARRRVSVVLDLQTHQAMEFDSQGDWINLAELMFHLGRLDLAAAGLDALAVFARRPEHRLRPWVEDRMQHLRAHVPERSGAAAAADESATLNELLLQLVLN